MQKEFHDALLEATSAGDDAAVAAINNRIRVALDQAAAKEAEQNAQRVISSAQSSNQQIAARASALQILPQDAHDQTLANLEKERHALMKLVDAQQQLVADQPFDAKAQSDLERYTTQLVELNATISKTSDQFHDLKVGAINALQDGLAKGIDDSITGAKSLSEVWFRVADDILQAIQKIIDRMIAEKLVQGALSLAAAETPTVARVAAPAPPRR